MFRSSKLTLSEGCMILITAYIAAPSAVKVDMTKTWTQSARDTAQLKLWLLAWHVLSAAGGMRQADAPA